MTRDKILTAIRALRKQGYTVIWKKATGISEFDVPFGHAGFDIRFMSDDFDAKGNLVNDLLISWQEGVDAACQIVGAERMWNDLRTALVDSEVNLVPVMYGPGCNAAWGILAPRIK